MPKFTIDPQVEPGSCDVLIAMGITSPGVAVLQSGGSREYRWDIKQASGVQGYVMTYRGWKAGEDIVFRHTFFENPASYVAGVPSQVMLFYTTWVPLFAYDAFKFRPTPVTVYHPVLAANDITALVGKKIGPLQTDGQMRWWIDMTYLEFRKAKIVPPSTPIAAVPDGGANSGAAAKLRAELEATQNTLDAQNQALQ